MSNRMSMTGSRYEPRISDWCSITYLWSSVEGSSGYL